MIARHFIVLLTASMLAGCTPYQAMLASLIPDGTANAVLSKFDKPQDGNSKRIAALEAAGNWEELVKFSEENIEKDPVSADWHFVLGYARMNLKQFDAAARAFSKAASIEPDNVDTWNYLAQAYRASGDPRRAVNSLNNALNITRGSPTTLYLLGESYGDMRRYNDALVAYREAVGTAPEFALAWYSLARTYRELGRSDEEQEARAKLQKLDPKLAAQLP